MKDEKVVERDAAFRLSSHPGAHFSVQKVGMSAL
jgi:hypothetical protein